MVNKYGADDSEREEMFIYSDICDRIQERRRKALKLRRRQDRITAFRTYLIVFLVGILIGYIQHVIGRMDHGKTPDPAPTAIVAEQETEEATEVAEVPKTVPTEPVTASTPDETASEEAPVHETASSTWRNSTKTHDLTVNSLIRYDESHVIANFSACTAVGYGLDSGLAISAEADFGFEVSALDADRVAVRIYDNSGKNIQSVFLTAGLAGQDYALETAGDNLFILQGYKACPDGLGVISVTFSNDITVSAGVFKEQGKLYAVNIENESTAVSSVNARKNIKQLMDEIQIAPEDALFTDPIYYPIVPVTTTEATDTAYWLAKSAELTEENWSDAHKMQVFYLYITQNMAYDHYVLSQNDKSRSFLLEDYSGDLYISKTNIGICQDFANIMAILCRGQGIPALVMSNSKHAVTIVYMADYGRWVPIDCTSDVQNGVYGEDMAAWVHADIPPYSHLNVLDPAEFTRLSIGNESDMEYYDVPDPYKP